ncbi:hypothetical protein PRUPE_2G040900 [Prunus persica]|uniref:Uncharacterized protein n=2 Tax=Prunus persica TaxID=3760 RepID=M5X3R1_PRUPE|nr:hypothetical protein PRUPE_2G040900 [Prunus persica]
MVNNGTGGETYFLKADTKDSVQLCYVRKVSPYGLWRAQNPLMQALPVLVMRMIITMFFTHLLVLVCKPLHQPRIVPEILGGMALGVVIFLKSNIFPLSSLLMLETAGNFALVYHMFLVGLELDFKPILRAGKKSLSIALVGIVFCVLVGFGLFRYLLYKDFDYQTKAKGTKYGPFFWGIALATTNFSDLAGILADLKLLYSDVGGLALSASVISDLCSWFLLLTGMAIVNHNQILAVTSTLAFVGLCVFVVRPALSRIINRIREGARESNNIDYHGLTCYVMAGVVLCGLITDAGGSHSMVGPFIFGAIMPRGEFSNTLIEKLRTFVPVVLMPIYYSVNGVRVSVDDILNLRDPASEAKTGTNIYRVVAVFIIAFVAKIVSTFVAGLLNKMSPRDSLALGFLMNTKGLLTIIILNAARDLKVLNRQTFSLMMVAIWMMTFFVGPFLAVVYKSTSRPSTQYKQRNIGGLRPKTELRILACIHTSRDVPGTINLLDASNPTKQSPIHVLAVHLVELTGHTSAMLLLRDTSGTNTTNINDVYVSENSSPSSSFELYAKQRDNVFVQTLTAVSAYTTMHQDICSMAEENRVALIIIPFHQQYSTTMDGGGPLQESNNSHLKSLNNNLIANARCSVGVFVDRGLGKSTYSNCRHHFAMLFIGGVDDREALAYAARMAGHPHVRLTVVRFNLKPNKEGAEVNVGILEAMENLGRQKTLDDLCMDEFRLRSMTDTSIELLEKLVISWEQTLTEINAMEGDYDMVIVGRRHESMSNDTATMFLDSSNDSNEIGVVGNELVSSASLATTSILIVQQGGDSNYA